jgi:hypothetical protein
MRRQGRALIAALMAVATCLPAGVSSAAGAEPVKWTFDADVQGWTKGLAGVKGTDNWGTVHQLPRDGGIVQLDGTGGPGQPNAWISKSILLPGGARTLDFDVSAHDTAVSDSHFTVRLQDATSDNVLVDETVVGAEGQLTFRTETVDISRWAGRTVTLVFEQDDNGVVVDGNRELPGGDEQILLDNIRIVSECDIKGVVFDGTDSDGHHNPLAGIAVDLLSQDVPVGAPMVTGPDGSYCLPQGDVTPGDYQLRASLVDTAHSASVFQTRHAGSDEAVSVTIDVKAEDFGRQDLDVVFSGTTDQPWLPDVANIHWQSSRFVDWLVNVLALDPAKLGGLVIETGAPDADGTRYSPSSKTVFLQAGDTPFTQRMDATTECPENCEWHEISHHVGAVLGIAPTAAAACVGRTNHGGWLNNTTCDSLAEGFATFLPTIASLDIDAGRGPGYATPSYSVFGSMEDNGYRPWSSSRSGAQREDLAVAQLLWDLADDTPNEATNVIYYSGPGVGVGLGQVSAHDRVAIGGTRLVHLLGVASVTTVADIYDALVADPNVAAPFKAADLDVNGDGTPDASPLGEVFVEHGFNPAQVIGAWRLDDPIGVTQPGANNLAVRRNIELVPGSGVLIQNASAAPTTVSIDVAYPSTSSHLEVVVGPHADRVVHLELPPYWTGILAPGAALPACGKPDARPVSVTLSASGAASRTISSCEFIQAVAATSTDSAVTYPIGNAATAATPNPSESVASPAAPSVALGGAIALAALVLGLVALVGLGLRRKRTRSG